MLNGIGGRTIREAKDSMTHEEMLSWKAYMRKRGSLNIGRRLESGFALLAMVVNRTGGGKAKMDSFMPYEHPPEQDYEGTAEDALALLTKLKVRT